MTVPPATRSRLLHPQAAAGLAFFRYRHRFLLNYVLIGVLSLAVEIVAINALDALSFDRRVGIAVGVSLGIFAAYWLNVSFNFKVPERKRQRALRLFVTVSLLSVALNFSLKSYLSRFGLTYAEARFASSGILFLIAYTLHRRFTFSDAKRVGIAIYANSAEDMHAIWEKVGAFPSFIHVDVVDESFSPGASTPSMGRLEVVRAFWPHSEVHVHIMSRYPSRWISEVAPFADRIIVHREIAEPVSEVLDQIVAMGRKSGVALRAGTAPAEVRPFLDKTDMVLVLAIAEPGRSGQEFQADSMIMLDEMNAWPERTRFSLCVDGGVNERNIGALSVENVVSGSAVLNHPQPHRQIMRLRTSSGYEKNR